MILTYIQTNENVSDFKTHFWMSVALSLYTEEVWQWVLFFLQIDLRAEIEILKQTLGQHEAAAVDKEKEVVRKMQGVKEEEWQKIQKLETEK